MYVLIDLLHRIVVTLISLNDDK